MRTIDKAWRLAISHKKCSFCENPAVDYEKFKFYSQLVEEDRIYPIRTLCEKIGSDINLHSVL